MVNELRSKIKFKERGEMQHRHTHLPRLIELLGVDGGVALVAQRLIEGLVVGVGERESWFGSRGTMKLVSGEISELSELWPYPQGGC